MSTNDREVFPRSSNLLAKEYQDAQVLTKRPAGQPLLSHCVLSRSLWGREINEASNGFFAVHQEADLCGDAGQMSLFTIQILHLIMMRDLFSTTQPFLSRFKSGMAEALMQCPRESL